MGNFMIKTVVIVLIGYLCWANLAVGQTVQTVAEVEEQQQPLREIETTLTEAEVAELLVQKEAVSGRSEKQNQETHEEEHQNEDEISAPGYSKREFNHCCHYLVNL